MIRITQLKLSINHTPEELSQKIRKELRLKNEGFTYEIVKQSLDCRHKEDKKFVYTVDVSLQDKNQESKIFRRVHNNNIMLTQKKEYTFPSPGEEELKYPPVIVGSGPAGIFCAWYLAKAGYRPLVLERGEEAHVRQKTVENFWKNGVLDPDSNVQFGEGGAGTFSDGKLNTLVKDPSGRNHEVLKRFVQAGAPSEIIYQQKPHLGTDVLVGVVETLRHEIEEMGGKFQFRSKVTDLFFENSQLKKIEINGEKRIPAQVCVLAVGHSARDSFFMFEKKGIYMEPKSFAVGVRMEHPQSMINLALYGEEENEKLGAAAYKVTHTCENGRGVYSFCMCPGGYVVNASSEPEMLAVNGMSYQARDSRNANSAMIVTVSPQDYVTYGMEYLQRMGEDALAAELDQNPLAGIFFQRYLEQKAYQLHEGRIPVQTYGDFHERKETKAFGEVEPCIRGRYAMSNLREIFPDFLAESLDLGIAACGRKIHGFDRPDAILSGVESRTSSPVRISRNEQMESNVRGFYPCGEGAGYAGGITSAAMDGLRVAEAVCKKYCL